MRQVDRSSVKNPACLARDLSGEIVKIREGGKARTDIYRHDDVVRKLRLLYLDKCFLCEKFVGEKGEVEHFLPWHKEFPERAYDWENLNLSCKGCNRRKRKKPYRVPANSNQAATKTVLIDPSDPPFGCDVEELIGFDKHREAVSAGKESDTDEVQCTLKFLNDAIPLKNRNRRWDEFVEIVFQSDCKSVWWEFRDMRSINPDEWHDNEFAQKISALERADALCGRFLSKRSPFYTCMKYAVSEFFRLSVKDFRRMSSAYRKFKGLPAYF